MSPHKCHSQLNEQCIAKSLIDAGRCRVVNTAAVIFAQHTHRTLELVWPEGSRATPESDLLMASQPTRV